MAGAPTPSRIVRGLLAQSGLGRRLLARRIQEQNRARLGDARVEPSWVARLSSAELPGWAEIASAHHTYIRTVSSRTAAVSLETTKLLWFLLHEDAPRTAIDTGSGFSSFLLRSFAKNHAPDLQVLSVDDSPAWLDRTREYLESQSLEADGLLTWEEFQRESKDMHADLVFHDIGAVAGRAESFPTVLQACGPKVRIVLDDMHKGHFQAPILERLREARMQCVDLTLETIDREQRFAWLALRSSP